MSGDNRFRIPNWAHQQVEWDKHRNDPARALLWQMRTGKTKSVIDKACYLFEEAEIDAVLLVAQNGIHDNWVRKELPKHLWDGIDYRAHVWRSGARHGTIAERQAHDASLDRVLDDYYEGFPIFAVNTEALINPHAQIAIRKLYRRRKVYLVIDESHDFRTPSSTRSRVARGLGKRSAYKTILSGTPVHNTPLAAYAQFDILHPGALGHETYTAFKNEYAEFTQQTIGNGRTFPKLSGYKNLEKLRDHIAYWSTIVLRSDCEDLPEIVRSRRVFSMNISSDRVYTELKRSYGAHLTEAEAGIDTFIDGENPGVRMMKMQQALSGFVITETYETVSLVSPDETNPRVQALLDELVEAPDEKAIVWAQFHADIAIVRKALTQLNIKFVEYHGLIPSAARPALIEQFQKDPDTKVFLGQPKSGGQGLDLSAASKIIWYSHTFDAIVRDQASERATKMGGESIGVVDIVGFDGGGRATIDDLIINALDSKQNVSDYVAGPGLKDLRSVLDGLGL